MKFGLIGGKDIKKYTIADLLWEQIREVSNLNFEFEIFPIETSEQLSKFIIKFNNDENFIGFNVALPWKDKIVKYCDEIVGIDDIKIVNTVFKRDNKIIATNTDIQSVYNLIKNETEVQGKSILILGEGGAGKSCALYLQKFHPYEVYVFDIKKSSFDTINYKRLHSYKDILENKYDILVNATPQGKFYFKTIPESFNTPISHKSLRQVLKKDSTVLDMNYLPYKTEFLSQAELMGSKTISGVCMLVTQATESFRYYTGISLSEKQIDEITREMVNLSLLKEDEILRQNIS